MAEPTTVHDEPHSEKRRSIATGTLAWIAARLSRRSFIYWIAPLLLFALLIISVCTNTSLTWTDRIVGTCTPMIKEGLPLAIVAIGAGLVLATGGVDLSSMGVASFSGIIAAACVSADVSQTLTLLLCLMGGGASGYLLGRIVAQGVPPLISSWAIGSLWTTVGLIITTNKVFGVGSSSGVSVNVEGTWMDLWDEHGHGIRSSLLLVAMLVTLVSMTNFPKRCRAIGANRDSAVYAGIRTRRTVVGAYVWSGVLSALAGVLWTTLSAAGTTVDRVGGELYPIAIAVLGGTVMTGGFLNLPSIVMAAFLWTLALSGTTALPLASLGANQQFVATAAFAALLLAIALLAGRRLGGFVTTITTERKAREGK